MSVIRGSMSGKGSRHKYKELQRKVKYVPKWTEGSLNFEKIREECLQNKILFEDPEFPAEDKSIFLTRKLPGKIEWKRPREICQNPHFNVEGFSRFDIKQGSLGDCWLLASISSLVLRPQFLHRIIPLDQSLNQDYAGVFHFWFWQYGRWIEVVIDDRLPTFKGELMFLRSTQNNEFWSALLEKAYAKLNGSYEALSGGDPCESMEDFTGGLAEMFNLKEFIPDDLYKILKKAYEKNALLACSTIGDPNETEATTTWGIILGHAYSITSVRRVSLINGETRPLLRIRNPWGNNWEWNEKWSDNSDVWNLVSEEEKMQMGFTGASNDGEFWMSYNDWISHFDNVQICHIMGHKGTNLLEGEWKGATAGGCRNNIETFHNNPQFSINIDKTPNSTKSSVIIALMQKNRLEAKQMGSLGMEVYDITNRGDLTVPLKKRFFTSNSPVASYSPLTNLREIYLRLELDPGTYVVVPSRFDPGEEGKFVIRIISDQLKHFKPHDRRIEPTHESTRPETLQSVESLLKSDSEDRTIDAEALGVYINSIFPTRNRQRNTWVTSCFKPNLEEVRTIFSRSSVQSIFTMKSGSRRGGLTKAETERICKEIRELRKVFEENDKDKSGYLNSFEIRDAFEATGISLSNKVLIRISERFGGKRGTVSFEDFTLAVMRVRKAMKIYDQPKTDTLESLVCNFMKF